MDVAIISMILRYTSFFDSYIGSTELTTVFVFDS